MLSGQRQLTLDFLNTATQAWAEIEYNRKVHRELGTSPITRWQHARDVLRASPSSGALRDAFRLATKRRQRTSDGTISLAGIRFEIPARYRHFRDVYLRYARWDLGHIDLVDPHSDTILAAIDPLDRAANADGKRSIMPRETVETPEASEPADKPLPPLLQKLLDEYLASGAPPAYLPHPLPSHQPKKEERS